MNAVIPLLLPTPSRQVQGQLYFTFTSNTFSEKFFIPFANRALVPQQHCVRSAPSPVYEFRFSGLSSRTPVTVITELRRELNTAGGLHAIRAQVTCNLVLQL